MRSIRFGLIAIALCGLITLGAGIGIAVWAQQGAAIATRQGLAANQLLALRFHDIYAWSALAVVLVDGLVVAALASLSISIRRLREQQQEQAHQAMHDPLTGLPNRRYLGEWLAMALAAARRGDRQVALLYVDLDGFKSINDRFGHEVGDRVLQVTATRMRATLRASDFFARLGGDEFVAVLTDAPEKPPVSMIVERLHEAILKSPTTEVGDGEVRASIGAAWFPEDGETIDALLIAADRAMYGVKHSHHLPTAGADAAKAREIVSDERGPAE